MPQSAPGSVIQLLGPSTGGIRMHVGELARELAVRGWTVTTLGPAGVMDGVGTQDGVVDVPAAWNPLAIVRARQQLAEVIRETRPDVVHAHGLKAALVVLVARRAHRPPLVVTVHNLVSGTHSGVAARLLRGVEARILRRADLVIAISDEIDQRLDREVPRARRTFVLPVAPARHPTRDRLDVRAEHGIAPDDPLVVVVARHHPQKDLGMFLRAFARVVAVLPTARGLLVGDGPARADVERERARLGLTGSVVLAGQRPNPADEMNAADVVALSSRWEGSPLVVAECLSLGRPLVTTDVGTVTRHLTDGVDARVVPVGDEQAFAAALVDLLTDPQAACSLGEAGRRVAAAVFDRARLVDGVEAAYHRAAGDRA
jgi:glycosyltransferase involved in cell wall biosynthesis